MMKHLKILFALTLLFALQTARADEGMWLPQLLGKLNEGRMKSLGMRISAEDIYSINKGSLKDAIVSFGGFCTGEVISKKGLVLTNHHCGFDAIQNHTTLQNNYIRHGFWAKSYSEELANKDLYAMFIVRIDDVTKQVMEGISPSMTEAERQSAIDKNMLKAKADAKKEAHQDAMVKGFFEANQYYLFITEKYDDVRLVGAPPSSIGNFGQDTDNWMWPRHTGDFSMFRIYAGKDNKPAAYSADNVPFVPKRSLKVSLDGVAQNDFTFVFGFPGRTTQYLHSAEVEQIRSQLDPLKIGIRDVALREMNALMRADEGIKIKYAAKYARIQNAYKKWKGEVLGLTSKNAVEKKKNYEAEFQKRVEANPNFREHYATLLTDLATAINANESYAIARDKFNETTSKIDLYTIAIQLNNLVKAYEKGGEKEYNDKLKAAQKKVDETLDEFDINVEKDVATYMMELYLKQNKEYVSPAIGQWMQTVDDSHPAFINKIYSQKNAYNKDSLNAILAQSPTDAVAAIKRLDAVSLFSKMKQHYDENIAPTLNKNQAVINKLNRTYMQAQMEVFPDKKFYPDANSTLRVTYGQVQPYNPRDAVQYHYITTMDGIMEKYIPGDYEFDLPSKLIELYNKKDFGPYALPNGKMPVNFIATNHTTGGNSGSPVLDAYGNLIGLNFDRVWEGTMSDINYDASICRNIMVDIRYVMFVVDKFANAQNLVSEIEIVHPKKNKPTKKTTNKK